MTTVTISQPRYLPACNYIQRMELSDIFVYLDNVKYSPRDWENRNKIKLTTGKTNWMSVPIIHRNKDQLIKDTMINNQQRWWEEHLNMLICNYGRAKYFKRYIDFFRDTYSKKWYYLIDLNIYIIDFIIKELGISCNFVKASDLNVKGTGQDLLINICKKLKGDIYISGPLGRNYIEKKNFEKNRINLYYHDYKHPVYPQMHGEFLEYMSVIDLLFNCGEESREYLSDKNDTKENIKMIDNLYKVDNCPLKKEGEHNGYR